MCKGIKIRLASVFSLNNESDDFNVLFFFFFDDFNVLRGYYLEPRILYLTKY